MLDWRPGIGKRSVGCLSARSIDVTKKVEAEASVLAWMGEAYAQQCAVK